LRRENEFSHLFVLLPFACVPASGGDPDFGFGPAFVSFSVASGSGEGRFFPPSRRAKNGVEERAKFSFARKILLASTRDRYRVNAVDDARKRAKRGGGRNPLSFALFVPRFGLAFPSCSPDKKFLSSLLLFQGRSFWRKRSTNLRARRERGEGE